ncbi:glycoside hydrolase family 3 C-terminal domain-containing protein [candidate division KSB1 bacterium]|nr:glycoside hydrolase family 3 C-terminal domain-containing protein [candidate division KSB1 bacterium]
MLLINGIEIGMLLFALCSLMILLHCVQNSSESGFAGIPPEEIETNIDQLISKMTLEEKITLVAGQGMGTLPIERLGIPPIWMTDGPLGPNKKGKATNYSACINMAATWDTALVERVAQAIGEETRGVGCDMILAPCINIARVPHGGRTFEGFGEDPYLVTRMAVAYVKGVQQQRVSTCVKHYACNNQEWNRSFVSAEMDERALREIYLPAFKAAILEADAWSIMTAYNRYAGVHCSENEFLLLDILKGEWGFKGIALSDWGGTHSTVATAKYGLDLEMPDAKWLDERLVDAVKNGEVKEAIIDDKIRRIIRVMYKLGLFKQKTHSDDSAVDTLNHRRLALEVARKSIVLLKNENRILPLDKQKIKSIAVIGPNAEEAQICGGGSGSLNAFYKISVLEGLRKKAGGTIDIKFARGVSHKCTSLPPLDPKSLIPPDSEPGVNGLKAEYFNNMELEGEPVLTRIDANVDFDWGRGTPAEGIVDDDHFSARWTGQMIAPGTGTYEIGMNADNGVRIYVDEKLIVDEWSTADPGILKSGFIELIKGKKYDLRIEFFENLGDAMAKMGMAPKYVPEEEIGLAVEVAKQADIAILCVGLNDALEGESYDRKDLSLPPEQLSLIQAVADVNENTIVILYNATPVLMNDWLNRVPAVIEAFYPGQEGGTALTEILFGEVNPSGKLPLTFINAWEDSPAYGTYPGTQEIAVYSEGIFVGYRHFDKHNTEPLFPFGFGLSYTAFEYSDLAITPGTIEQDGVVKVTASVKNTGKVAGDEIVQLYLQDMEASLEREVKALKGFQRISLNPGETKRIEFSLDREALSFFDMKTRSWVAEPGQFRVLIGCSSRDIRLEGGFELR